ncbi:serine/threonine protein kinase [Candidatus Hakubella thermalkaliphila]|uniref:non-specific serine/threonine protein kinase n=1 Tax=Candidatus Hakubella thermalkaliphila TaxID=2754717 RepID=A0A6V8P4M4_9ACTN|nr:serine/threonine-protein kinase [Candidatus Hakubella thermalkaliphila]GFP26800.1 eukaryotic-like serine/threonine-protein kinase [Candidatus Hakubella thermalkaliphila]
MEGEILFDRYEIEEEAGSGGFATVYKAFDRTMKRTVAIKAIQAEGQVRDTALREARLIARLTHPNIITVFDILQEGPTFYIIMEYVEGLSLEELVERVGELRVSEATSIIYQLCDAIEAAHLANIIHKDIKPANIMITRRGRIKVTDFGIADILGEMSSDSRKYVAGTVVYMSPEQYEGQRVDFKSDIFSIGVVAYELLTGITPFHPQLPCQEARKGRRPPPPSQLNPSVPHSLDHIILKCLQVYPEERYSYVGLIKENLSGLLDADRNRLERELTDLVSSAMEQIREEREALEKRISPFLRLKKFLYRAFVEKRELSLRVLSGIFSFAVPLLALSFFGFLPYPWRISTVILLFFLSYLLPQVGVAAALLLTAVPVFIFSSFLGFLYLLLAIIFFFIFLRDRTSALFLILPPLLAPLHLDLLYPLLAGYAFGPGMALATGVVGLLLLQWFLILFARGNLNLLAIAAPRLIDFLAQEGFIPSFREFFAYFFTQIPLIFQFLVWAVVCLVVGSLARRRHLFLDLPVILLGASILGFSYLFLMPKILGMAINLTQVIQTLALSTIIMVIIISLVSYGGEDRR